LKFSALRLAIIAAFPLFALSFATGRGHQTNDFRQSTGLALPKPGGVDGALAPEVRALERTPDYELAPTDQRIHLLPQFTSGEILRYEISTRMTTSGTTTSPIENPEGASLLKQSADMIIRLDILDVQPASGSAMGRVHLRATYEKSDATSETDAYDPQAAALADQFARLQGRSVEFTIEPDGKLSGIIGLEDILSNPSMAQSVRAWMIGLSSGAAFPQAGIALGQKWTNEQPLLGTPLAGLIWRTESAYLRNEPCRSAAPAGSTSSSSRGNPAAPAQPSATPQPNATSPSPAASSLAAEESCAVILTRVEILRRHSHDDPTPKDYRRNSLSTSGTWTGSGESLDSIFLSTGLTISSTQTSTQNINLTITSTRSGARMNYTAHVESRTEIRFLPATSAQAQPQTMP
jgi:hypothetical protein